MTRALALHCARPALTPLSQAAINATAIECVPNHAICSLLAHIRTGEGAEEARLVKREEGNWLCSQRS